MAELVAFVATVPIVFQRFSLSNGKYVRHGRNMEVGPILRQFQTLTRLSLSASEPWRGCIAQITAGLVMLNHSRPVPQVQPRSGHKLDCDSECRFGNKQVIGGGNQPFHPQVSRIPLLNVKFEPLENGHPS